MRRIGVSVASVLFLCPASAFAIQCDRPPTVLGYALCQNAGLRSMVEEGALVFRRIWQSGSKRSSAARPRLGCGRKMQRDLCEARQRADKIEVNKRFTEPALSLVCGRPPP